MVHQFSKPAVIT